MVSYIDWVYFYAYTASNNCGTYNDERPHAVCDNAPRSDTTKEWSAVSVVDTGAESDVLLCSEWGTSIHGLICVETEGVVCEKWLAYECKSYDKVSEDGSVAAE